MMIFPGHVEAVNKQPFFWGGGGEVIYKEALDGKSR